MYNYYYSDFSQHEEVFEKMFLGRIEDCKRTITREKENNFFFKKLIRIPTAMLGWDSLVTRMDDLYLLQRLGYRLAVEAVSAKWKHAYTHDDLWVIVLEKGGDRDERKRVKIKAIFSRTIRILKQRN